MLRILLKNSKGITLIELLASIAIFSFLVILVMNVHLFGQKQFTIQNDQIEIQLNLNLAVSSLTKELRKSSEIIINKNSYKIGENVYTIKNNNLLKNGKVFARNIQDLSIEKEGNTLLIKIESIQNNQPTSLTTKIINRE